MTNGKVDPELGLGLRVALKTTVADFRLRCSFQAEPNASIAVVGPNGSGKSTLLNVLAGLVPVDDAKISLGSHLFVDTERRLQLSPERRPIGYVPQASHLFPHLSVMRNIGFGLRYQDTNDSPEDLAAAAGAAVGVRTLLLRPARDLSGGQRQRVALARALVLKPALLLMDEPLANVDADSRLALRSAIDEWKPANQTQIVATHGQDHIKACDLIVALDEGVIVATGSPSEMAESTNLSWLRDLLRTAD